MSNRILTEPKDLRGLFPGAVVLVTYTDYPTTGFTKKETGKWTDYLSRSFGAKSVLFRANSVELVANGPDPDIELRNKIRNILENTFPGTVVTNGMTQSVIDHLREASLLPTPDYLVPSDL